MHRNAIAALLTCFLSCLAVGATAADITHYNYDQNNIANRLNYEQLSWLKRGQFLPSPVASLRSATADIDGAQIGIVFFRGDGGDPKDLRVDDATLMYIAGRTGEGRTYQNGREVEVQPAVKESAGRIAVHQFRSPNAAQLLVSELPPMAQAAVIQFAASRATPRLMFARVTSRDDAARVSDIRATQIMAMETSVRAAGPNDMVDLVRTAMLMFGFKSDACDKISDPRCDRPGVREAFAQIKREEALKRTAAVR